MITSFSKIAFFGFIVHSLTASLKNHPVVLHYRVVIKEVQTVVSYHSTLTCCNSLAVDALGKSFLLQGSSMNH